MIDNDLWDKILDDLIDKAAPIAAEELGMELPDPDDVEFSKEHENAMRKLFRKEQRKLVYRKVLKYSKRAAVFFLAIVVVSGVFVFSVEAWRVKVLNFVIDMSQTHSEINFSEEGTKGDSYASDEITLGYIPEGFKLDKKDVKGDMISLVFKGEESYFIFSMREITGSIGIDTEDASVKKLKINGHEALFSSNENVNILVWHDEDYTYSLSGTVEENEMAEIARSIKK